jgi:hypothetical protein
MAIGNGTERRLVQTNSGRLAGVLSMATTSKRDLSTINTNLVVGRIFCGHGIYGSLT